MAEFSIVSLIGSAELVCDLDSELVWLSLLVAEFSLAEMFWQT